MLSVSAIVKLVKLPDAERTPLPSIERFVPTLIPPNTDDEAVGNV